VSEFRSRSECSEAKGLVVLLIRLSWAHTSFAEAPTYRRPCTRPENGLRSPKSYRYCMHMQKSTA
jgi:hypothetical protein